MSLFFFTYSMMGYWYLYLSPPQKNILRLPFRPVGLLFLIVKCGHFILLDKSSAANIVSNKNTPGPFETTFSFENPRNPFSDGTVYTDSQAFGPQPLPDSFTSSIGFIQGEKIQIIKIFEVVFIFRVYIYNEIFSYS